jgi:hypothetical protein
MQPVIIANSKSKLIKLTLASIVFVSMGLFIVWYQPEVSNTFFNNPPVKYGAAIASIIFGLLGLIYFLWKLKDAKPGLIIDASGITDNASAVAAGFIPWKDIKDITLTQVMNQSFIMIIVHDPESYIQRQTSAIKRTLMNLNYKHYASPINITANGLSITLPELKAKLDLFWQQHKQA